MSLTGEGDLLMGQEILTINTDDKGNFLSIIVLTDNTMTIAQWNNLIENITPK